MMALNSASSSANDERITQVLALSSEAASPLGFHPHVVFDGPVDTVDDAMATELLAVLGEALANVARHAQARRVDVEVTTGTEVVLRVTDDGRGLPGEVRADGRGMLNMRTRASRLGGTLLATSGPALGAVIEWRVPVTPLG
jgi:signal transduction histidine kinase